MIKSKRGISAIIEVVLLIAFTITLFLLISNWIRGNIVDESLAKTEEKLAGQLDCLSTTVEISNVCVDDTTTAANVQLNVDNSGDTSVTGVTIRVLGGTGGLGAAEYNAPSAVPPLGRVLSKIAGNQALNTPVASPTKVEVYPKISSGLCKDNFDSTTNIVKC